MWFFNNVPKHLPKAYGKYLPGIMDVMLDYAKSGLFLRFYYPTNEQIKIETMHKKWPQVYPDYDYVTGMGSVAMLPQFILYLLWLKSGNWCIPGLYGATPKIDDGKLKCVVFSHGLGAFRGFSSAICIELASRGYLVVVIEHRDESACHTYYYNSKEDAASNKKQTIKFKQVQLGKGHYEVRKEQVHLRAEEMSKTLDFLINLNNGSVPHNVIVDTLGDNADIAFKLSDFVGKIDVENFTAAGHSFGGATALLAMAKRSEFKQGLLLDPWMYPIKGENLDTKLNQPLLFINTQTFHIATNVKAMEPYLNNEQTRKMVTIMRSTHENQTDLIFMAGYWLNWFMKKIDAKLALAINNSLALQFLKDATNHAENIKDCERCLEDNEKHYVYGLTKPWA